MEVAKINAMYFASRRHLALHLADWAALWPSCHWPTPTWPLPLLLLFLRYKSMDRIICNKFPHSSLHPTRKVRVEKHAQRWCNHLWSQLRRATTLSSHATLSHTTLATTPQSGGGSTTVCSRNHNNHLLVCDLSWDCDAFWFDFWI